MRLLIPIILLLACNGRNKPAVTGHLFLPTAAANKADTLAPNTATVIHVFVALCDNKNQGIVPVPAAIGNGQDPANNLYWDCGGGVKGFFKKSKDWKLIKTDPAPGAPILERCIFKHRSRNAYLVADAYDGAFIKQCTVDFFNAAAGRKNQSLLVNGDTIGIGGSAQLIAYTGHDGLMDFSLSAYPSKLNNAKRETIVLACISKRFFRTGIERSGATPLLWSTGLMSPEAYTLEAAITGWLQQETPAQIQQRAAAAYDRYQHCIKGASRLIVTGW
jgi:hypothetical protein